VERRERREVDCKLLEAAIVVGGSRETRKARPTALGEESKAVSTRVGCCRISCEIE
jgi:hypothetical protein